MGSIIPRHHKLSYHTSGMYSVCDHNETSTSSSASTLSSTSSTSRPSIAHMSQIWMTPEATFKVSKIKNLFRWLPDSYEKTKLLKSAVISCNYRISETSLFCGKYTFYYLQEMYDHQTESDLTSEEHLQVFNLQNDCEIGVTIQTRKIIDECMRGREKNFYPLK